jgi:hypothetical protein
MVDQPHQMRAGRLCAEGAGLVAHSAVQPLRARRMTDEVDRRLLATKEHLSFLRLEPDLRLDNGFEPRAGLAFGARGRLFSPVAMHRKPSSVITKPPLSVFRIKPIDFSFSRTTGESRSFAAPVCTENLSSGVVVVKSAKDGV